MTRRPRAACRLAVLLLLILAVAACCGPATVQAQDDGQAPAGETSGEAGDGAAPARGGAGGEAELWVWHFSIVWLVVFVVLLAWMTWFAYWASQDAKRLKMKLDTWIPALLGANLLVVLLLVGAGKNGVFLGLVGMIAPIGAIVAYLTARDKQVDDEQKILTAAGMNRIRRNILLKFGIRTSSGPEFSTSGISVDGLVLLDASRKPMEEAHRTAGIDKDLLFQAQQILVDLVGGRTETSLVELRGDQVAVTAIRHRMMSDYVVFPAEQGIVLGRYYSTLLGGGQPLQAGAAGGFCIRPPQYPTLVEVQGKLRQATETSFRLDLNFEYDKPLQPKLSEFSLLPRTQEQLAAALSNRPGMVVVGGPAGQGTSTSYYAMVSSIDGLTHDVVSFEQTIEREIPHSRQFAIKDKTIEQFRQLIGEVAITGCDVAGFKNVTDMVHVNRRDVVQLMMQQARQALVVGRIEAPDSISALSQLVAWSGDPEGLAEMLSLVVNQRLVGRLCDQCKQPVQVDEKVLARAGIPPNTPGVQFFQKQGCRHCLNSGYAGLTPVIETLVIDEAMKQAIRAGAAVEQVRQAARRNGSLLFLPSGTLKAASGLASISDVYKSLGLKGR